MQQSFWIFVEDALSEAVVKHIVAQVWDDWQGEVLAKVTSGNASLLKIMPRIQQIAQRVPALVLTDLDRRACPQLVVGQWINTPRPPKLVFRVAVREVESWLLADLQNCAAYLGVSETRLPRQPELEDDPKQTIINLARRSRMREIKDGIPPGPRTIAAIGPGYNSLLIRFVHTSWNLQIASQNSRSLNHAIAELLRRKSELLTTS